MISFNLSNRIIFVFSLLGLSVASFLFYEYGLNGPIVCPTGQGCDIVRASSYSSFFGIPVPILGIAYYFTMAILSVVHSHYLSHKVVRKLQLLISASAVGFGIYLTFLEAFIIKAYCFWCVLSFIISVVIFLAILSSRRETVYENRN